MAQIQARVDPRIRTKEAVRGLREKGEAIARDGFNAAQRRPAVTIGVVAVLAALLARRPIARLFGRKSETRSHKRR